MITIHLKSKSSASIRDGKILLVDDVAMLTYLIYRNGKVTLKSLQLNKADVAELLLYFAIHGGDSVKVCVSTYTGDKFTTECTKGSRESITAKRFGHIRWLRK